MIDLDTTDLQCIRRALTDFIRSKENSTYSFPYYSELNARINNAIYSEENNKLQDKENGEMKIWKRKNKTTTRTIKLGSNYIKFLEAVGKYRHLPYPEYKRKLRKN